jgi:GTP-binding protein
VAFIDEIQFTAKAGAGGNGVVRWRQEKFIPKGGPAGGDGGRGGDVYAEAIRDVHILAQYRNKKEYHAGRGEDGGSRSFHGANGEDLVLKLPIGSRIKNLETGMEYSLEKEGEKVRILKGGAGGRGNEHFKSSVNTTPRKQTDGKPGEEAVFTVELELFADVGLVGFPNAGKSSLLNMLTNAEAKVGDYAFTTLDPNLGDFYGFIIADIPGLIEGASEGKGLGTKFLRHIKRTKILAHLISFENLSAGSTGMIKAYKAIRKELQTYGGDLDEKEEIVILTKTDVLENKKVIEREIKKFEKLGKAVLAVSLYDDASVKNTQDALVKILRKK